MFQGMFAIINPRPDLGARSWSGCASGVTSWFLVLWATLIYDPLAHWVWGSGGWLLKRGALDFAGASSYTSAPACRRSSPHGSSTPARLPPVPIRAAQCPLVLLGAGLLWFAGSASMPAPPSQRTPRGAGVVTPTPPRPPPRHLGGARPGAHRQDHGVGAATGLVVGPGHHTGGRVRDPDGRAPDRRACGRRQLHAIQIRSRTKLDDALDVFSCTGSPEPRGAL